MGEGDLHLIVYGKIKRWDAKTRCKLNTERFERGFFSM